MATTKHRHFDVADIKLANSKLVLSIDISYSKGGTSWYDGGRITQGVKLGIMPMEKGNGFTSFTMGGPQGFSIVLVEASRYNENQLRTIAEDLKANGEKSILYGAAYKEIIEKCCEANKFVVASSDEEVFKEPELVVGQRVEYIKGKLGDVENIELAWVVGKKISEYRGGFVYDILFDSDWLFHGQSVREHDREKLRGCDEFVDEAFIATRMAEYTAADKARKDEEIATAKARQNAIDAAVADLKERYPWAKQTGTGHARASANLKAELTMTFPGVPFSVTSNSYSGGDSVRVEWTDGPTQEQVKPISDKYQEVSHVDVTDLAHTKRDPEHMAVRQWLGSARYVSESRRISEPVQRRVREALEGRSDLSGLHNVRDILHDSPIYGAFQGLENQEGKIIAVFDAAPTIETAAPVFTEDVIVRENPAKGGIEIKFNGRPDSDTISKVKANGFRWSKFQKLWYAKANEGTKAFAYGLTGQAV